MDRPRIKIEVRLTDKVLDGLTIALLTTLWVLIAFNYVDLPERIPTHFSLSGEADSYGSRSTIFVIGIVPVFLAVVMWWVSKFPHHFNYAATVTEENAYRLYSTALRVIRVLKVFIVFIFLLIFVAVMESLKTGESFTAQYILPGVICTMILGTLIYVVSAVRKR